MPSNFYARHLHVRVKVNDTEIKTTADVRHSQSYDTMASVAEFTIAEQPNTVPAQGDAVEIDLIDVGAGRAYPIFGGSIDEVYIESQPWMMTFRCVDQLEKLRRTRSTGDFNLTGMTDGEAVREILDLCDIDFDEDDIVDCGYELGSMRPVKWLKDGSTSGGDVLAELDRVMGCATMTIGHNRVIRVKLDRVPTSATGKVRTYTKGKSIDFRNDARTLSGRDQIQSFWRIDGVTKELANGCTQTPWAEAKDGNPEIGRRTRTSTQSDGSDFIQDESLARIYVRRMMRIYNRYGDNQVADMQNVPAIRPGSKIAIFDGAYGMPGAPVYGLVLTVERTGVSMTVSLEMGPPGDEGTVTSGVDRVCGDAHGDDNIDDGFTDIDPTFPPDDFGIGDGWDFDLDPLFPGDFDPAPEPFIGCTVDASLQDCTDSNADFCFDDPVTQTTDFGSPPPDACWATDYQTEGNRWFPRTYTVLNDSPSWQVDCVVKSPWRNPGDAALYRLDANGNVTAIGAIGPGTTSIYANTESDPALQDASTDSLLSAPNVAAVSGSVTFTKQGAQMNAEFPVVEGGIEIGGGAEMRLYATPGQTIDIGDSDKVYGVRLATDYQSPIKTGDGPPNQSFGAGNRDNGGNVESSPAELGTAVAFSYAIDETEKAGWGRGYATTDLGSGYIDHLDYLNQTNPLPGEPSLPPNTCAENHDGHKLAIRMISGTAGSATEPAVWVEGMAFGHTTCEINPDYEA